MTVVVLIGFPLVFVAGFTAGLVLGIKVQHRKLIREAAVQVRDIKTWVDKWQMSIVSLFMVATALLIYHGQQQHNEERAEDTAKIARAAAQVKQLGECVAAYDNRLSASLQPVRKASKRNGAADIEFKRAVAALFIPGHDKRDIAAVKKTLHHNLAVYDSLTREREKNPYPSPPKKVCASDSTTP